MFYVCLNLIRTQQPKLVESGIKRTMICLQGIPGKMENENLKPVFTWLILMVQIEQSYILLHGPKKLKCVCDAQETMRFVLAHHTCRFHIDFQWMDKNDKNEEQFFFFI